MSDTLFGGPRAPQQAKPLTVSELTQRIKDHLEGHFFRVWVTGELSHVHPDRSGNVYLTLKDGADAKIECMVWRSDVHGFRYRPGIGEQVVAWGRLSVYAPRGEYKLVIQRLEPAGLGEAQAALAALKQKLQAEGLLDPKRKRRLPPVPRAVGVVTSGSGAARRDIEQIAHRRSPQIPIVLYPAQVQGRGAAADIAEGIRRVAERGVEVVIVGRGGGSKEDLWAFNEEAVARAIAACPVPVISAVGHQTDTTLADLVADLRVATPSEAAEAAFPVRDDLRRTLALRVDRLDRLMAMRLERGRSQLAYLQRGLALGFHERRLRLQRAAARLDTARSRQIGAQRARLHGMQVRLQAQKPEARLARARRTLEQLAARLAAVGTRQLTDPRRRLGVLAARLDALSPLASLERGYSITRRGAQVLRSHDEVAPGDRVEILLRRGRLEATVSATHAPDEEGT